MYMLSLNIPQTHVEEVKEALFNAGAGRIGQYTHCSWQILGEGQFMPLQGSNAFIGAINQLEKILEYKVEMVCGESCLHEVIAALKKIHPYETPAYQVWKLEDI